MKKIAVFLLIFAVSLTGFAHRPHSGRPGPFRPMPPPPPRPHFHYVRPLPPPVIPFPIIVPQPHPVIYAAPQRIWVPPVYEERPVYRAGIYIGTERVLIRAGYWR